jgi:hypothetical protein
VKPELVKLLALRSKRNEARRSAYLTALMWTGTPHGYKAACRMIARLGRERPNFLDLIANAIKGGSQFEPTTPRRRQIEAWWAAYCLALGPEKGPINVLARPTLPLVKQEFKRLFPKARLPVDRTFRRTFAEIGLPLEREPSGRPPGRPPGSKDSMPRKPR